MFACDGQKNANTQEGSAKPCGAGFNGSCGMLDPADPRLYGPRCARRQQTRGRDGRTGAPHPPRRIRSTTLTGGFNPQTCLREVLQPPESPTLFGVLFLDDEAKRSSTNSSPKPKQRAMLLTEQLQPRERSQPTCNAPTLYIQQAASQKLQQAASQKLHRTSSTISNYCIHACIHTHKTYTQVHVYI